jgi:hypothetical protein
MPFDGANYGSEVLRLLRRGRDRIMNSWTKGRLAYRTGSKVEYCLIGSIVCGDNGAEECERTPEMLRALRVINIVIGGKCKAAVAYNREISAYNDRATTSHSNVVNVMNTAVKLQELEEFQHAE